MSKFFDLSDFFDSEGNLNITDNGCKNIMDLSNIVLNTHYGYVNGSEREDLLSVGVLKCFTLLQESRFDPTRSSLKNYLYTGIRNEMKNYLYKNSREVSVEDEILNNIVESEEYVESGCSLGEIHRSTYNPILAIFEKRDASIRSKVLESLNHIGFVTDDKVPRRNYYAEAERIMALIIWSHMEKSR